MTFNNLDSFSTKTSDNKSEQKLKHCWYLMLLYPVWICIPRTFCFQNRSSNFTPDYMALAVSETDDITHESIQCVPACIKPFLPNGNAQLPGRSNSDALDFKHCPRSFHTHSRIRKQICSLMLHIETEETD